MPERRPLLDELRQRWRRRTATAAAAALVATALPLLALASARLSATSSGVLLALTFVCIPVLVLTARRWRRAARSDLRDVAAHLDRVAPEAEDSAGLLAGPAEELRPLERLQRARLERRLGDVVRTDLLPRRIVRTSVALLVASVVTTGLAVELGGIADRSSGGPAAAWTRPAPPLTVASITVAPPAYLGLPVRTVDTVDFTAEEGSSIRWEVATRPGAVDTVTLEASDGEQQPFTPATGDRFTATRTLAASLVYTLRASRAGREVTRTPWARVSLRPDAPPRVRLVKPDPVTELAARNDRPNVLSVEVAASDDHAVAQVALVLTLAEGAGEQVAFRERRRRLDGATAELDLAELGMRPGAELYLRAEAVDNRSPEPNRARSATHLVRWPGREPARAELAAGLTLSDLPAQLRSQRQIILDTEALLAERDRLTAAEVELRARGIGFDQSALRLRHGALLGEEFESGLPVEPGHEHDGREHEHDHEELEEAPDDGSETALGAVPTELLHQHDTEESATFFPDDSRRQLRAMLAAMWQAEGELRAAAPEAALPHEYRALRLLKDLQQRARVYVRKVGFDTPPLDVEALRLTGELDDIRARAARLARETDPQADLRAAFATLQSLRLDRRQPAGDLDAALAVAGDAIRAAAERSDEVDLGALDSLRAIERARAAGAPPDADDVARTERALWSLLPPPERHVAPAPSDGALFDRYRGALLSPVGDR